ncbi:hypothetical protein AB3S75_023907 [Citrus x aurantiifolia]
MNPYDEQRLRDEVLYLHSLWHLGPPGNPNPSPNSIARPRPRPRPEAPSTAALRTPTRTTPFKKKKNNSGKQPLSGSGTSESEAGLDSGPEWPVNPPPPVATGWPIEKPKTRPEPLSAQDQAKLFAMQVQHRAIESCIEFFSKRVGGEGIEDDESEELDEEDYLTENDKLVDSEVYKFLLELFVNDEKLRGYYEKNNETGDFSCLVCFGIGKKVNKRYKDCVGLVQHSISISKTKIKRAHRAFGQVVCKVLGWDIDRLPVIVLKGEPLGKSLAGLTQDVAASENDEVNVGHMTVVEDNGGFEGGNNGEVIETVVTDINKNDGKLMICENAMKVYDGNKCLENPDSKAVNMEADKDLAVDCHTKDANKGLEELDCEFMNPEVDKDIAVDCQESGPSLITRSEWSWTKPVDENSSRASGWPTLKPKRPLVINLASAEEQAKLSAGRLQQKILDACQEFFVKSSGSDRDESDDEDADDLMDEDRSDKSEVFKFFLKVFTENSELRSYYEKYSEDGEFCCLVCGGIGKKVWKRFKDCHGLLQHSTGILKTKKKRAHRAFGQVVCKVLGWDIDRLPMIVLKGEPLSHSLSKSGVSQTSPNEDDANKHINNVQDGSLDVDGNKREQQIP